MRTSSATVLGPSSTSVGVAGRWQGGSVFGTAKYELTDWAPEAMGVGGNLPVSHSSTEVSLLSCWGAWRKQSGKRVQRVALLNEVPISLLIPHPAVNQDAKGTDPPRGLFIMGPGRPQESEKGVCILNHTNRFQFLPAPAQLCGQGRRTCLTTL